ncbi:M23 family metallopeptidase [Streptomyces sp. SCSIO 30461]|uniref:M23 family metallopeptidase n=1 Tax=Streptomyces sp. SCSIO 30461 TaxID=3118085 RepID=UPI0030D3EF71
MNDQHPDAGYDSYPTGSFDTDPLFGSLPGDYAYATGTTGDTGSTGQHDTTQWQSATATYDSYATAQGQEHQQYDTTGQWDTNVWNQTGQFETAAAAFAYDATGQWPSAGGYGTTSHETGTYDATAWNSGTGSGVGLGAEQGIDAYQTHTQTQTQYAEYGQYSAPTGHPEHAEYAEYTGHPGEYTEHTGYYTEHAPLPEQFSPENGFQAAPGLHEADRYETGHIGTEDAGTEDPGAEHFETSPGAGDRDLDTESPDGHHDLPGGRHFEGYDEAEIVAAARTVTAPAVSIPAPRPARRGGSRGRRRTPAKRSAMLTVAVPSVCVMGVAGVAAASVGGLSGDKESTGKTTVTAADPTSVQSVPANSKLDTQLAALSADARDFGDRASRTQERIDLKARQEADRKKREAEAARREALRPKFALPVSQSGLSAYFGQAGVNWMSMHTGIDFPVSYGTPVKAATDGTVRTQWNSAYGNMAIVTAADGTETWYCHLSSTKIRSGSVKAGDVIAFSGNSGNSTGPHLHFEVRPGGGDAINPLSWLRSHGLDPT